jgi:hypothetical protein
MEPSKNPAGVFPHNKHKPSSIHISQQSQESTSTATTTAAAATTLQAPLTPRIDISRASSSSYHEDSSPENVFDQVRVNKFRPCLNYRFFNLRLFYVFLTMYPHALFITMSIMPNP